ncbi:MAG: class I SAM-dependent methyltransferase [Candidatus Levybacteria bacterium]|nr:class I SAM-dependent methyltransferase [Candidatus Levybacteria bacterium]
MSQLSSYYSFALEHKKNHRCGGVPYDYGDVLKILTKAVRPVRILELGTGVGYSTACFAEADKKVKIDTIDQDGEHLAIAQSKWVELGIEKSITTFCDKAEAILPELHDQYDMIFFDGYDPSLKFLLHFERLLKNTGLLITANLYLKDETGGRYMRHITDERRWSTSVFEDTAISIKML